MKDKLIFGVGNAKLSKNIATFSLPAGHSCPFANECLSKANRITSKLTDGPNTRFRCFAASQENTYTSVRKARWKNFDLLREANSVENMAVLIQESIPKGFTLVRVHVSGDFYNERYFLAWLNVAYNNPQIIFYGYTKCLPFLIKYKKLIPSNFRFTASKGGKADHLINKHKLKYAEVVFSMDEAKKRGLEIDHDDSLAIYSSKSFGLLLHGTQPPGSEASRAWRKLIVDGIGGYSEKHNNRHNMLDKPPLKIYVTALSVSTKSKVIANKVLA